MRYLLLFFAISLFGSESKTTHIVKFPSATLAYEAIAGSLPVRTDKGKEIGQIHYISYCIEGKNRPLTFVFNGGPGSSSVWLHLGVFGPKRVLSPEEGQSPAPPYSWVDNQETLLDMTDLVFVDPIGSGMSQVSSEEEAKKFYSSFGDVHSIGDFICDFLTEKRRWNSPLYLAGESYGTFRAAGLADYLQGKKGIYLNGVILISCAINFATFHFDGDSLLPYFLFFPTYATTAWFQGRHKTEASLEEVAEEARRFAYEIYAPALLNGFSMNPMEREIFYQRISQMTGLSLPIVQKLEGKIDDATFFTEFFQGEKKILGRFDTRATGPYTELSPLPSELDPSFLLIRGIFSGAMHAYLDKELKFPVNYQIFSEEANRKWKHSGYVPLSPPNFMEGLRRAMIQNPRLKVFVGSGYFDAATPFAATEYCFNHLNLPAPYRAQVQIENYAGGHMYYLTPSERVRFKRDLIEFYSTN